MAEQRIQYASASKSTVVYAPSSSGFGHTISVSFSEAEVNKDGNNCSVINCSASISSSKIAFSTNSSHTLSLYYYDTSDVYKNGILMASKVIKSLGKNSTESISGSITVPHNDSGNLSCYVKAVWYKASTNAFVPPTTEVATDWTELTHIDRYFSTAPFISVNRTEETKAYVNWSTSEQCNWIRYHLDGSSNWVDVFSGEATSGTFEISGLVPGTTHSVYVEARRADSGLFSNSNSINISMYNYPYAIVTDFVIGQKIIEKVVNPLNRNISLELISNNDSSILGRYEGTFNGDLAGFNTPDEVEAQYLSITDKASSTYYAKVTYNDQVSNSNSANYSVDSVSCRPDFEDFDYKDINSVTLGITEDEKAIIKGYSNIEVNISAAGKMVAKNHASPRNYVVSIDSINSIGEYSIEDAAINVGEVSNSGLNRLIVRAYDSRNLYTEVFKDINILDYTLPVVNISATRLNNFENETTIIVSGTFEPIIINETAKNTIKKVEYRYNSDDDWKELHFNVEGNKYICDKEVISLDNTKSFNIQVRCVDNLDSNIENIEVPAGEAIFKISSNKRTCYIRDKEVPSYNVLNESNNEKNIIMVGVDNKPFYPCPYYPVGSIYMSINDVNPGEFFGGTWKRIANGRTLVGVDETDDAFRDSQKTGGEKEHTLTIEEMPHHQHNNINLAGQYYITAWNNYNGDKKGFNIDGDYKTNLSSYGGGVANDFVTGFTGNDNSHNNLQPYFTCYIWCRIA